MTNHARARRFERAGEGNRWVDYDGCGQEEHGGDDTPINGAVLLFLQEREPSDVYSVQIMPYGCLVYYRRAE